MVGRKVGDWGQPLTGTQCREGAVLVQPCQGRLTEALHAGGGDHPIEGLKEGPDEDAELWVVGS